MKLMPDRPSFSSLLRRALPILTFLICVALLYDGFVFYIRWRDAQQVEREREKAEADRTRRDIDMLGGDKLKILAFYAAPPAIHRGDRSLICFGVNAAKSVRIEPPVEELHPALSRCFQVSPRQDTEYKLIATDAAGHTATESLVIRVAR